METYTSIGFDIDMGEEAINSLEGHPITQPELQTKEVFAQSAGDWLSCRKLQTLYLCSQKATSLLGLPDSKRNMVLAIR